MKRQTDRQTSTGAVCCDFNGTEGRGEGCLPSSPHGLRGHLGTSWIRISCNVVPASPVSWNWPVSGGEESSSNTRVRCLKSTVVGSEMLGGLIPMHWAHWQNKSLARSCLVAGDQLGLLYPCQVAGTSRTLEGPALAVFYGWKSYHQRKGNLSKKHGGLLIQSYGCC